MAIKSMAVPARTRESKYDYSPDDARDALDMLNEGQNPGDTGFKTAGAARSASNVLLAAIAQVDSNGEYGARVWQDGDTFAFAIKRGKRQYHGRKQPAAAKKSK